jgi:iron complex outermembrane receptor protein
LNTTNRRNPIAKAVKFALVAGATITALTTSTAFAAEEEEVEEDDNKVTVTGSRIKRTDYETASSVHVTSSEDIALSGFTKIEDLMNSLPQIEAGQTSFISNGSSGTANLDLRGLGANRTLVLINGRRLPPGGVFSQAPDINQIPAALVERAEVLTGGGSSTYGSDAVAGVVNFIMNNDFEGIEVTYGVSGYRHDNDNTYIQGLMDARNFDYPTGWSGLGGITRNLDITVGGDLDGGKGHATAYATVREINELRQGSRDYSSCALNNAGTACGGSGNAIVPNFFIGDISSDTGVQNNYAFWTIDEGSNFIPSVGNAYNYAPVNHFMRPDKRYSLGAFVDYEINEHVRPYLEIGYMRDITRAQIAESGTFFAFQYNLDINSTIINDAQRAQLLTAFPSISDGSQGIYNDQFSVYIGKRNVEGGPRSSNFEHNAMRIIAGADGAINDMWDYDASIQYSSTNSSQNYVNDFFAPRIATAIDPVACAATAGCIEYPVFTRDAINSGNASPLTGVGILNGVAEQVIFNAFVTGDLDISVPGSESTVFGVFGIENRKVKFSRQSDEVFESGLLLGQGGPTASLQGKYDVQEFFGELNVPILEGVAGAESLALELGYRWSDYSTAGAESTYKVGVDWAITENWKARASFNRAVRAPNVAELFSTQSLGLWTGLDPCAGATPVLTAAQCANTGVTASQYGTILASPAGQYNGIFGGNPELEAEIADTYTFGIVANPIEGLNFSVDYFSIEIEDVIGAINAEITVTQCGITGGANFCNNVTRSASGSLWRGNGSNVQATQVNLANRTWEGVDVSANYTVEGLGGMWNAKIVGTQMLTKEYDPVPGDNTQIYDCVDEVSNQCFPQPEWRHTASVTYTPENSFWSLNARWRYFGAVAYTGTADSLLLADGGLDAQSYFDITASFELTENINVLAGISNLLDEEPPLVGGSTNPGNANTYAGFYDTLGQYLHASVTLRF